jgi:Co/Zn/Cd efflux system component
MHIYNLDQWKHSHRYVIDDRHSERNTRRVILLTLSMMIIEISAGYLFGSMALLADGWHMGTHAVALGITAFAYYYARQKSDDPNCSFGTGKIGVLGGFASAVVLAAIALLMGVESFKRLLDPSPIRFNEAIAVAVLGLIVNLISAWLLQGKHGHAHHHHDHSHSHQDHNLRAAYRACTGRCFDISAGDHSSVNRKNIRLDLDGPGHGHCRCPGYYQMVPWAARRHRQGFT